MAKQTLAILVLSLFGITSTAQVVYFPRKAFSKKLREDQFVSEGYSRDLRALNEPSLFQMQKTLSTESYRFLWLRSFHHPVAIRLDLKADGSGVLTTKIANGEGGYGPGVLTVNNTRLLTQDQVRGISAQVKDSDFWSLPSRISDQRGEDGSEWIVEGAGKSRYHVVSRWSPENGPVRKIGLLFLIDLAQMEIPKGELY